MARMGWLAHGHRRILPVTPAALQAGPHIHPFVSRRPRPSDPSSKVDLVMEQLDKIAEGALAHYR
jgi:hypothetical protein